jgi:hypothetical protein
MLIASHPPTVRNSSAISVVFMPSEKSFWRPSTVMRNTRARSWLTAMAVCGLSVFV